MNDAERPEGLRFSQLYIERSAPQEDSARARRRLASLVYSDDVLRVRLDHFITARLGIDGPRQRTELGWSIFFAQAELRDVLDIVTLGYEKLQNGGYKLTAEKWCRDVQQIFQEENVGYEVDDRGGVHYLVDQEFERNRASVLAGLGQPRYANVARNFERGYESFLQVPPDGRGAVRSTFDAAEGLFKLMFPGVQRLTSAFTQPSLKPIIEARYAANPPALAAALKTLDAFDNWISACHNYRHEHGQPEVIPPPLEIAVQLVSAGATYLRWLLELDDHMRE